MANRITQLDGGTLGAGGGNPVEQARSAGTGGTAGTAAVGANAPSAPGEQVDITDSARTLSSLANDVQQSSDIDQGRVASIQKALASGAYHIDPDRIASRMLQLERDLSGTQQR